MLVLVLVLLAVLAVLLVGAHRRETRAWSAMCDTVASSCTGTSRHAPAASPTPASPGTAAARTQARLV